MNEMSPIGQDLAARIDRLGEIAVRVGLALRPGQEIVMTAPLDALPLARRITEHAYRAGAKLVTTFFSDDVARLARFHHAPDDAFDYAPAWQQEGVARAFREGAARLAHRRRGSRPARQREPRPCVARRARDVEGVQARA